jgi:alpha-L-fucosidase 2
MLFPILAAAGIAHAATGPDMNAILSLALVKNLFKNIIPMSETLGVDADKRDKWRDIVERISDFPLQEKDGKTLFRYSEKGTAWWNDNTLGIQHIFPAGAIGLDSDPKLLEISHNTINAMSRWRDFNGSSSWYTACARVGYDPKKILSELANMYSHHALPNKLLNFGGGGIENVSPALAVTEMLMQSHDGVIRLFPCWPREMDARFGTLRAVGAFLVSAEMKDGVISGVRILSEKGGDCVIANPWPEKSVRVIRSGNPAELVTGPRFTLKTSPDETIKLNPE